MGLFKVKNTDSKVTDHFTNVRSAAFHFTIISWELASSNTIRCENAFERKISQQFPPLENLLDI